MHLKQFRLVTIYWQINSFLQFATWLSSFYFNAKAIYHLFVTGQKPNKMHHCEMNKINFFVKLMLCSLNRSFKTKRGDKKVFLKMETTTKVITRRRVNRSARLKKHPFPLNILTFEQNSVGGLKPKIWIRFAARLFGTYSRVASDNIHTVYPHIRPSLE